MDISQYNTRVIQEPRGMIRLITLIFAILAFATTSGFDTYIQFQMSCPPPPAKGTEIGRLKVSVEYPFKFDGQSLSAPYNCTPPFKDRVNQTVDLSKMDFSSSAQFYVATGVLSFLYSTACLVLYIFGTRHYETNPLVPVIDLGVTAILTIFWLAGSSAWAAGVSDVKHYTSPSELYNKLEFCSQKPVDPNSGYCWDTFPGKFTSLNISLIFGFANILLWAASSWFVFKETQFHRKQMPDQMAPPGQQGFDQFGGQMAGQQQMQGQTHFPQQRQQFADGY